MDFGKVASPDGIDFSLPPLTERSRALLARAGALSAGAPGGDERWLYLGAPAWARRDWLGTLYPRGTDSGAFLATYARKAGAIELNATHYKLPDEHTIHTWAEQTPPDFKFCPKLSAAISHEQALVDVEAQTAIFAGRMRLFGPRLGPTLLQLGPEFAPDRLRVLTAFLERWPRDLPLALELRHPAWFRAGALRDDLVRRLETLAVGTAITDVPGRRDVCHASLTAPEAMIRFVGNDLHPSDLPRADAWVDRLAAWRALGLRRAFFFVHQPDDRLAPELLSHAARTARHRGIALPPIELEPRPGKQLDLFA